MGLDFIERARRSIAKKWDRERVRLATADLLTRKPEKTGCSIAFDIADAAEIRQGQIVNVEVDGSSLVASVGMRVIARVEAPPSSLIEAMKASSSIAQGKVEHVHDIARVAEIQLC